MLRMPSRRVFALPSRLLAAAILAAVTVSAAPAATAKRCSFGSKPTVLLEHGDPHQPEGKLLLVWEERDRRALWGGGVPAHGGYADYAGKLARRRVATDPLPLLAAAPTINNRLVLRHARDWIRPATCFEKLLVGQQHGRMDMLDATTEFVSVVLDDPRSARIKVYYYTVNRNGIGGMSPVMDPVGRDAAAGWRIRFVLHNHSFFPADPKVNGVIAPSVPDAHFQANIAQSHGLPEARITNGIDTVRLPAASFAAFERE